MAQESVFVSGFGPFEKVLHNSSSELAVGLEADPPAGIRVHSQLLPVSFDRSAEVLSGALAGLEPSLLVGLGQQPAHGFRLELRAASGSGALTRPDVDGMVGAESSWCSAQDGRWPDGLWSPLEKQLMGFARGRSGWMCSAVAGSYVCERVFRWLLEEGEARGIPAIFVHLPPLGVCAGERQLVELKRLLSELDF